jgi:hypothetical protein
VLDGEPLSFILPIVASDTIRLGLEFRLAPRGTWFKVILLDTAFEDAAKQ